MKATRKRNQSNTNEKLGIRAEQQSTLTALHVWVTPIISGWIQAEMLSKFQASCRHSAYCGVRLAGCMFVCLCERDSSISHEHGLQHYLCPVALVSLYFSKTRAVITTQQERHGKYTQNNTKRLFCTTSSKSVVYKKKKSSLLHCSTYAVKCSNLWSESWERHYARLLSSARTFSHSHAHSQPDRC